MQPSLRQVRIVAECAEHRAGRCDGGKVLVRGAGTLVAGLENDIHDGAERVEQGEEGVEEPLTRHGRGDGGHLEAGALVPVVLDAEAFARHDGHLGRGADRVGQGEIAVATDVQMIGEFGIHVPSLPRRSEGATAETSRRGRTPRAVARRRHCRSRLFTADFRKRGAVLEESCAGGKI